jgi:hypothetical protein
MVYVRVEDRHENKKNMSEVRRWWRFGGGGGSKPVIRVCGGMWCCENLKKVNISYMLVG